MKLREHVPITDIFLELEPEEVGGIVLDMLKEERSQRGGQWSQTRGNFTNPAIVKEYPRESQEKILEVLAEGWDWLEHNGFIAAKPGNSGEWCFVTRRGQEVKDREGMESYRKAKLLPKEILHEKIRKASWSEFIRGDYESAVFKAVKCVEVGVRKEANLKDKDIGIKLIRSAFALNSGPLTNKEEEKSEQESMAHLFTGAIGAYKNPLSHRSGGVINDPVEAAEIIILSSHLLKIAEARGKANLTKSKI